MCSGVAMCVITVEIFTFLVAMQILEVFNEHSAFIYEFWGLRYLSWEVAIFISDGVMPLPVAKYIFEVAICILGIVVCIPGVDMCIFGVAMCILEAAPYIL